MCNGQIGGSFLLLVKVIGVNYYFCTISRVIFDHQGQRYENLVNIIPQKMFSYFTFVIWFGSSLVNQMMFDGETAWIILIMEPVKFELNLTLNVKGQSEVISKSLLSQVLTSCYFSAEACTLKEKRILDPFVEVWFLVLSASIIVCFSLTFYHSTSKRSRSQGNGTCDQYHLFLHLSSLPPIIVFVMWWDEDRLGRDWE